MESNSREGKPLAIIPEVDGDVEEDVLGPDPFAVAAELGVLLGAVLVEDGHESPLPAMSHMKSIFKQKTQKYKQELAR